ncbi:MAG: 4Fe-4S binding protein [Elusimicrobiota bacterium]|jgi:NADH-quinone oxidoreductase subunit F|nr:4Fe-4S binding protein [Elusimicrobiota bacterium]
MSNLETIGKSYKASLEKITKRIIVCAGTGCAANGSLQVYDALLKESKNLKIAVVISLEKENKGVFLSKSACQGLCQRGPRVIISPDGILYTKVKPEDAKEILERSVLKNEVIERLCYNDYGKRYKGLAEIPFFNKQCRIVTKQCGFIDPENIDEYIAEGGYKAAEKVCKTMDAKQVCDLITESNLRGKGGGGFPAGRKWEAARIQKEPKKYVICNGDEGDPGAFMDRSVMEGNPHSVIEGMIIASKGVGADEGFVYVRTEYAFAVERMKKAVKDAQARGILGKNIFDSGHNFTLHVMEGAGAFVCGEATAMIASIEGKRGMPKPKPPRVSESGLWGKPTVLNNVETFASAPYIINEGVEAFKKIGPANSPGTKTFALTGYVKNSGLIEVPFGATLRHIIFDIAGGVVNSKGEVEDGAFKAVQIGGPSGGCLTAEHLDLPIDFDSIKKIDAMVGSGGLVVMNQSNCMVNAAKFFMQFTQNESCGKCVLCREGTKQMLLMLEDITAGRATSETLELLEQLAKVVKKGSLCGLGQAAPNPVLSTLKYFKNEYEAHVKEKRCPAGECKELSNYYITDKCRGCTLCSLKCPAKAISGEQRKKHIIDQNRCLKCGVCITVCKFQAIERK